MWNAMVLGNFNFVFASNIYTGFIVLIKKGQFTITEANLLLDSLIT